MLEIGPDIENIPRLSQEEKAKAQPLTEKAWGKSMELLAGREFCTIPYGDGASSPDENSNPNQLVILNLEKVSSDISKAKGIDLIVQLDKSSADGYLLTEIYYFYKKDGGRVIKKTGISRNPNQDIHEANKGDLEQFVSTLEEIKKDKDVV
jgi:hypothetical protein